jgi:hypothetical protein
MEFSDDHVHGKRRMTAAEVRGDLAKPFIEARSGHAISSSAAAERLKVSDETIRTRIKKNKLIGYYATGENRKLRLPEWQFSGPKTIHVWVQPLIEAFGGNGWALIDFVTIPRTGMVADTEFKEESLLQRIQAGDIDVAITAAQRANPV